MSAKGQPYYEVMSFWEAKGLSAQVPMALVSNVGQVTSGVITSLLTAFAGKTLDSVKDNVTGYLGRKASMATLLKALELSDVQNYVETELHNDYLIIIDALKAGIGQGVGSVHAGLFETLAGTSSLLQSYNSLVEQVTVDPYITRWLNHDYTPNIPDAETAWFMRRINLIDNDKYKEYLMQSGWNSDFWNALEGAWTHQPNLDVILDLRRRNLIDDDAVKVIMKWYRYSDNIIDLVLNLKTTYPEPYRVAGMRAQNLISLDELHDVASKFGLEAKWADLWVEEQAIYPNTEIALMLLRRGLCDAKDFNYYLKRNRFGDTEIGKLEQLRTVIPPIQDLIRFAVREAYLDHTSEVQYPAMVDIAKQMGLSEEAAEWYWYAHWERIPINLMMANYHRGLWDKPKLERMLKIVDIHPDDRQDIINVTYQPPTVREMGYGYDVGAYTLPDIAKYRRFAGLSPEDADKSANAMVLYRTEGERNAIRTANMGLYKVGKITREQFEVAIREITPQETAVELWLQRGDLEFELAKKPGFDTEGRIPSSSESLTAFKLGLRNEEWTRNALLALDWTPERIDVAIEKAKLDIKQEEDKASAVKYHKLTLAQITNAYKLTLISKDIMTTEIILLGYSPEDADLLTEIYTRPTAPTTAIKNYSVSDAARLFHYQLFDETDIFNNFIEDGYDEPHADLLTLMTKLNLDYPILATLYEKGYINTAQFNEKLMKLGMSDIEAGYLIERTQYEYQVSRLAPERDLTKAEILKGAKNNVLTPIQASELLQAIGYDENEANYLLAINKVVVAGDPEGYWDMRKVTEQYKKARGEKYMDIPDELITLESEQRKLGQKLEEQKKQKASEEDIGATVVQLGTIEQRMKQVITAKALK